MSYKSRIVPLNPKNPTRRCSRCGMVNAPKGAIYLCEVCGLRVNRQLNASINLYLQMEGLPPSPRLFDEPVRGWSGFTPTGKRLMRVPTNPRGARADESQELCKSTKD
jgi:putative transposase